MTPEIHDLIRRLDALERHVALLPIDPGGGGAESDDPVRMWVGANNEIYSQASPALTIDGINVPGSPITSVPAASPADLTTTYADGLVAATLDTPGKPLVWLSTDVEDQEGTRYTGVGQKIPEGRLIYSTVSVELPVSGGGGDTATVYILTHQAQDITGS